MIWAARNDGRLWERIKRRGKSSRAAAFLEFALLAPFLMLMLSGMLELVQFFDSEVMASHTAWQVGRIATVRGPDLTIGKSGDARAVDGSVPTGDEVVNYLFGGFGNIGDKTSLKNYGNAAAVFLMSTCGIGMYGGENTGDIGEKIYSSLMNPLKELFSAKSIKEGINDIIQEIIDSFLKVDKSGSGILNQLKKLLGEFLGKVAKTVFSPIVNLVSQGFGKIFSLILGQIDQAVADAPLAAERRGRELVGAALRCTRSGGLVKVDELSPRKGAKYSAFVFSKTSTFGRLDYPQVVAKNASSDGFLVTGFTGWPPNNQSVGMYRTTVTWPFEMGWLFPVVSGFRSAEESAADGPVRAVGTAISFPKLSIENENLWSEGATQYADGEVDDIDTELGDLRKRMAAYVKRSSQFLSYRTKTEIVKYGECDYGRFWHGGRWHKHFLPYYDYHQLLSDYRKLLRKMSKDDYLRSFKVWNKGDDDEWTKQKTLEKRGCFTPSVYHEREYLYFLGKQRFRYRWPHQHSVTASWSQYRVELFNAMYSYYLNPEFLNASGCFSPATYFDDVRTRWQQRYPSTGLVISPKNAAPIVNAIRNTLISAVELHGQSHLRTSEQSVAEYAKSMDATTLPTFNKALLSYAEDLRKIADGSQSDKEKVIADEGEAIIPQDVEIDDPKKFAEESKKRWEKLERRLDDEYEEISDWIERLPAYAENLRHRLETLRNRRAEIVVDYTVDILYNLQTMLAASVIGGGEITEEAIKAIDVEELKKGIRTNGATRDVAARLGPILTEELAIMEEFYKSVDAQFQRETDYAKSLGSKNAGAMSGKSLRDVDWEKHQEEQKERGGGSTEAGDDPGMEAEKWKWTKDGWKKAG